MGWENDDSKHQPEPAHDQQWQGGDHPLSKPANQQSQTDVNQNQNQNYDQNQNRNQNNNQNRNQNDNQNNNQNRNQNDNQNNNQNRNQNDNQNQNNLRNTNDINNHVTDTSSSRSNAASSSSSRVGPISNNSDATGGNAQGGSINESNKSTFYVPPPVFLTNLPNTACAVAKTGGITLFGSGMTVGGSKLDQRCLDIQEKGVDVQSQGIEANRQVQLQAIQTQKEAEDARTAAAAAAANDQHREAVLNQLCNSSIAQGRMALDGYRQLDDIGAKVGKTTTARAEANSLGVMTVQTAGNALKAGAVCVNGGAAELGINVDAQLPPPITLEQLNPPAPPPKPVVHPHPVHKPCADDAKKH